MSLTLKKPMPHRLCEGSRSLCQSTYCVNTNFCSKLRAGYDLKELTADDIAAAKHYNDRILLEMGGS